ncbi:MAG: LysM peptidoglycan-binding domain-containing protein [Chloroflexota bacterium]
MQRDLGNEVIVAIAAVGILAFAITFAIILSLSNTPEATATATIASNIGGVSPDATAVAGLSTDVVPTENTVATLTSIAATVAQAQTNVPTETVVIVGTQQQVETGIPTQALVINETVEPGNTNAPTAIIVTQTAGTIPTQDSGATRSNTSEPSTPGQISSSVTATPRKTSATPTRGVTASPTFTPSPVPLSATPSPKPSKTPTLVPTLTRTPRPTETSGIRPTPTVMLTAIASISPSICVPPQGWVIYVVDQGDTLLKIAQGAGSSLNALKQANCLMDINNIYAGMPLYVPRTPVMPDHPYPQPGDPTLNSPLQPDGCTDPNSLITNLQPGQVISGVFNVMGTANLPDFWYYKLEVRPDFATVYNFYSRSETAVVDGSLGQIDQSIFGVGIHWIKLTVIGKTSGAAPCAIPVIFQ